MNRFATIKRCRKKDCPDKPASERRWCLISDKGKALRCAPTKKQCREQERNVNYFKHATARLTTASVQAELQQLPRRLRAAALQTAIQAGFRPVLVRYAGVLWRLR